MQVQQYIRFAFIGWLAGIAWVLLLAFVLMPNVVGSRPALNTVADQLTLGLAMLITTPEAMLGGVLGARMMREGGAQSQAIMAAIMGSVLTLPVACIVLWYVGW